MDSTLCLTLSLQGDGKEPSPSLPEQQSLQERDTVTEMEAVEVLLIVEPCDMEWGQIEGIGQNRMGWEQTEKTQSANHLIHGLCI